MSDSDTLDTPEANTEQLLCTLIPIKGKTLIVPQATVGEMAQVAPIFPDNSGPDWFLGFYSWRNGRVPLLSFEKLNGESVAGINPNGQIAVFNSTGVSDDVPFIAIPTQGVTKELQVSESDIVDQQQSEHAYEAMTLRVGSEEFVMPDITALQKAYAAYASTRRF